MALPSGLHLGLFDDCGAVVNGIGTALSTKFASVSTSLK